jgi:SAM-dependent methyltransferase
VSLPFATRLDHRSRTIVKDNVNNRRLISFAEKLSIARLVYAQNGLRWCAAFGIYYVASALSNRAFSSMDGIRKRRGVPGLNSLELNRAIWTSWNWDTGGEEWSRDEAWKQSIIHSFIDRYIPAASSILEIGPGGGRWTEVLLERASRYIGIDISASCIDACRARFKDNDHARFVVGSGSDLELVPSSSIHALWSFDVFVHINQSEVDKYADEFDRVLKPGAIAIVHHGTVGGAFGGWRSNLTQEAMMEILGSRGFGIVESTEEWRDGDTTYDLREYRDRITVFSKPASAIA